MLVRVLPDPRDVRRSILGEAQCDTPMVVPGRGYLDDISRMMIGDYYIGRGCRQRNLEKSPYCNDYEVSVFVRERAISQFGQKLKRDGELRARLWTLSGLRLVCHCRLNQPCHADEIIREFRQAYPGAYDWENPDCEPPSSEVLNCLARLRLEPEPNDEPSADEQVPEQGAGWRGTGPPMSVGEGYVAREVCDEQSLASPGRWPIAQRRYPGSEVWTEISNLFMEFAERHGPPRLLMELALGKVKACPFNTEDIRALKQETTAAMSRGGIEIVLSPLTTDILMLF